MIQIFYLFSDWSLFLLRLVLGFIMVYHGWLKLKNFKENKISFYNMKFKPAIFWLIIAILVEFVGGIFLIFGFMTKFVTLLILFQFLIIIFILKLKLFKKFSFKEIEFDLLILTSALIILTVGPGKFALDNYFLLFLF